MMETLPSSPQEVEARFFMQDTKNGAGNLKNVNVTGHSLGGYLAQTMTLFDDRINSATTFNAPGVSNAFKLAHPFATNHPNKLSKINAIRASGDVVSKIGNPLGNQKTVAGTGNLLNILGNHGMGNFLEERSENMQMGESTGNVNIEPLNQAMSLIEILDITAVIGLTAALAALGIKSEEVREAFATAWTVVQEKTDEVWGGIIAFFNEIIPPIIEGVQTKFEEFKEFWSGVWQQVKQFFSDCWDGIVTFAIETIPTFVETVVTFISELSGKIWTWLTSIVTDVGTWISDMVAKAQEEVPKFIESVITFVTELPGRIWEFFVNIVTSIGTWITDMVTKAQEEVPKFIESVINFFLELTGKIRVFLTNAVTKIGEWARSLITKAGETLPGVISSVMSFFEELPGKVLTVGGDLVKGIFNGISDSVQWLYGKLKGWVSNVVDYIKGLFGINSPSKLMSDTVGVGIAEGVADGISKNTGLVSDAMSDMTDIIAASDLSVEPEVTTKSLDFEVFKEKLRPSLVFVKSQLAHVQDVMTTQFSASAQLAAARSSASMNAIYNNGHTFNNNYTINAANNSPKATADAIKNQMTMQRMLFAN